MWEAIVAIIGAIAAFLKYKYDPATVAKQDEINKQLAEEDSYEAVDKALAGGNTVSLSYFISQYLRRVRPSAADSATGRAADTLIGVLPKPRSEEDRNSDPTEGF